MDRVALPFLPSVPISSGKVQNYGKEGNIKTVLWITESLLFEQYARHWDHHSLWVANALSALHQIDLEIPDLVICEADIVGVAEHSCLQLLNLHYPMLPIIAVVDELHLNRIVNFLRDGIGDILLRSTVDLTTLTDSVNRIFEQDDSLFKDRIFPSYSVEHSILETEIDDLMDSPSSVNALFNGLLPENPMKQGDWACHYQLLQGDSAATFMIDHVRLSSGDWLIYVVEILLFSKESVLTALSIRALMSQYAQESSAQMNFGDLPNWLKMQLGENVSLENAVFFFIKPYPVEFLAVLSGLRLNRQDFPFGQLLRVSMSESCIVQGKYDQICRLRLMPPS